MEEKRKATDVLLELENKINILLKINSSQDLNIKLLSNKLNDLLTLFEKNIKVISKPTIETANVLPKGLDPNKHIMISSQNNLSLEQNPQGFRRTSRPETYVDDKGNPNRTPIQKVVTEAEAMVPDEATQQIVLDDPINKQIKNNINSIPVKQRVVDKNSKSVFLADVKVINEYGEKGSVERIRTNGNGVWVASLVPGRYKVIIHKLEPVTKENKEVTQDIVIDGMTSPLELPMLIFK